MEEVTKLGEQGWVRERWVKRAGTVWSNESVETLEWPEAMLLSLQSGEWEQALFPMLGLFLFIGCNIVMRTHIIPYCSQRLTSVLWKTAWVRWMVVSVVEAGSRFKFSTWLWTREGFHPLLTDCLGPHNSKAVQCKAISIHRLITDRLGQYAAIIEPTDTEIDSLSDITSAFSDFCPYIQPQHLDHIQEILPVIVSIFKEPGNRKEAQLNLAAALGHLAYSSLEAANLLNDSGAMRMLLDTVRDGIEDKHNTTIVHALAAVDNTVCYGTQMIQPALDMGAIDALHEVLKRPNEGWDDDYDPDLTQRHKPWSYATGILSWLAPGTDDQRDAILSKDGLLELVLKRGMEVTEISEQTLWHHWRTATLLGTLAVFGSDGQVRRLMYKDRLLPLIGRYLKADDPGYYLSTNQCSIHHVCLQAVQAMCRLPVSAHTRRLRRLLFDDSGITDAIRRLTVPVFLSSPFSPFHFSPSPVCVQCRLLAISIFDTYLKDPPPPRPPSKLPAIIYTKNYPYYIPQ